MAAMPKEAIEREQRMWAESDLLDHLDKLPDEVLDRLADQLVGRIERRLLDRARRRGVR
jgi:hypothetical protein